MVGILLDNSVQVQAVDIGDIISCKIYLKGNCTGGFFIFWFITFSDRY